MYHICHRHHVAYTQCSMQFHTLIEIRSSKTFSSMCFQCHIFSNTSVTLILNSTLNSNAGWVFQLFYLCTLLCRIQYGVSYHLLCIIYSVPAVFFILIALCILINLLSDGMLSCSDDDLIKSLQQPSAYCVISGPILYIHVYHV